MRGRADLCVEDHVIAVGLVCFQGVLGQHRQQQQHRAQHQQWQQQEHQQRQQQHQHICLQWRPPPPKPGGLCGAENTRSSRSSCAREEWPDIAS
ncbi:hypothetical protein ACSSS7_002201 [Eimeria intestinalis]